MEEEKPRLRLGPQAAGIIGSENFPEDTAAEDSLDLQDVFRIF